MCGDVTLEFCGVTLTVLGILNVMHIHRAHVQAVITRVWLHRAFRVRITGVLSMEVEEDGVGYSSLVVGYNHAGPSGHA